LVIFDILNPFLCEIEKEKMKSKSEEKKDFFLQINPLELKRSFEKKRKKREKIKDSLKTKFSSEVISSSRYQVYS